MIRNQPWHFDGHLFCHQNPIRYGTTFLGTDSESYTFWIQAYDLPLVSHTEEALLSIASKIGELEGYEKCSALVSNNFLRFRVAIEISQPLRRGISVRLGGDRLWVPLKYESLPTFCFGCGVIGHLFKDCSKRDRDGDPDAKDLSFDSNLKALPFCRSKDTVVETDFLKKPSTFTHTPASSSRSPPILSLSQTLTTLPTVIPTTPAINTPPLLPPTTTPLILINSLFP